MKYRLFLVFSFLLSITLTQFVSANTDALSAYRNYQDVVISKISVPTVVELPISNINFERFDFLVFNKTSQSFEPSLVIGDQFRNVQSVSVQVLDLGNGNTNFSSSYLADNNESTFVELPVINDVQGKARVTITSNVDITTDSLFLLLDNYVALPNTISLSVETAQGSKTVLATKQVDSQSIYFPRTTARKFIVDLTYSQPLRITEIRFNNLNGQSPIYSLRFLAQPGQDYSVYFNPDRRVSVAVGEMTNLSDNRDILKLSSTIIKENSSYIIADIDGDKVPDVTDNCVSISNTDQVDVNQNGRGDVCDDFDKDGVMNSMDNCLNQPNMNQSDDDGDKIGDVCDGEESRITEKYKWLPWLGIMGAALVVIGLFTMTVFSMRKKEDLPPQI